MTQHVAAEACDAIGATGQVVETYDSRQIRLGGLSVTRLLPVHGRRLVGPWCFLDRIGPLTFTAPSPVNLGPHPHIGLQTVSWLLDGEMLHDDSLGSQALLRPGGVNVMTAGAGITHAERTPDSNTGRLNGAQLWIALPSESKETAAAFEYVPEVPSLLYPGAVARVFAGSLGGTSSATKHYSELVGADVELHPNATVEVPLEARFEHALIVLSGDCLLEGQPSREGALHYLGSSRSSLTLASRAGARVLLLGGPPFPETILMWWNFVARSPEEIIKAREDWQQHRRFSDVPAALGARMEAPDLSRLARPEPAS